MKFTSLMITMALSIFGAMTSEAATISSWAVINTGASATGPTTTSGLTTDSPTFGNGTSNDMKAVGVGSTFGTTGSPESVTLSVGQTLTVTATITLTGGLNAGGAYRFAVHNDAGQFGSSPDNWGGGWNHILDITGSQGLYQARTDGYCMSSSGNAVLLNSSPATSGTFDSDSTLAYLWTMSITRDSATTVDITSSFVGGDGAYSETITENDIVTSLFTYNAVGMQATSASDLDQLSVSGAQFTVIPEPSAAILAALAAIFLQRRKRN